MLTASTTPLRFRLPIFEGPLDLLLHLIREHEIDIYDIPIAEITQQYIEYLEAWELMDLTVAGEYLVMAATLIEIKSRMLLPRPPAFEEEVEDPRAELVERLLEYQRYQGAVDTLKLWEEARAQIHFRGALENPDDYSLPLEAGDLSPQSLYAALKRLLDAAGVGEAQLTAVVPRRRVSLRMKMVEISRKVRAHNAGLDFEGLFGTPWNRYDIVLTFLAMLELLRLGRIRAAQKNPHAEIKLYPVESTGS